MKTNPGIARQIIKKLQVTQKDMKFDLSTYLFDKQLSFVSDSSRFKIAMCSRRSGKTVSCAAHLIKTAIDAPDLVCLYITLSRNNAKKIIWKELLKINNDYQLGGIENISELSITFPNKSVIYLSGAKDSSEIEKFRGMAVKLVYIDEAQSFRSYIEDLITDVLVPSLMDYRGTLCLIGTPPPVPVGFFHDTFNNESLTWTKHEWNFFDNPHIVKKSKTTHQSMLDEELVRRGVTMADPSIQREWFGRCVQDTNSLLLHYNKDKNDLITLPEGKYTYLMGVDLGFRDANAIAVLAWSEHSPNIYLLEEKLARGQDVTDLMNMVEEVRQRYDISKIVIDTGGLGKMVAEELIRRHKIPLMAADKVRKMENVALLNDFLRSGRFKAKKGSAFAEDCMLVEIDKDKTRPDKIVVSDRYHSDIIDAVLYAFKESYAYTYEKPIDKPKIGTPEWGVQEQESMWESALDHFTKQQEET